MIKINRIDKPKLLDFEEIKNKNTLYLLKGSGLYDNTYFHVINPYLINIVQISRINNKCILYTKFLGGWGLLYKYIEIKEEEKKIILDKVNDFIENRNN